jgi:hypothetical protein
MTEAENLPFWRRLLQIRLRTIMIVVSLCCLGLGWYGFQARHLEKQQSLLKLIGEKGGRYETRPKGSPFMQYIMGKNYVAVIRVDLAHVAPENEDLKLLANFHDLERLSLHECKKIADGGLTHLRRLKKLTTLSLHGTKVKRAGLKHLSDCKDLKVISLQSTPFQTKYVAELMQFKELVSINLENIEGHGEVELHDLPKLETLNLQYCKNITRLHLHDLPALKNIRLHGIESPRHIELQRIKKFKKFKKLWINVSHYGKVRPNLIIEDLPDLAENDITYLYSLSVKNTPKLTSLMTRLNKPMDYGELEQLTSLDYIRLDGMIGKPIPMSSWPNLSVLMTDAILSPEHLKNLPQTTRCIHGDASRLTDADFAPLRSHPNMKIIRLLACNQLTNKSLEHFGTVLELTHLTLPHAQLTDEGFAHLSTCTKLQDVSFRDNRQLTGTGFQHLYSHLELTRVCVHNCGITPEGEKVIRELPHLSHLQIGPIGRLE